MYLARVCREQQAHPPNFTYGCPVTRTDRCILARRRAHSYLWLLCIANVPRRFIPRAGRVYPQTSQPATSPATKGKLRFSKPKRRAGAERQATPAPVNPIETKDSKELERPVVESEPLVILSRIALPRPAQPRNRIVILWRLTMATATLRDTEFLHMRRDLINLAASLDRLESASAAESVSRDARLEGVLDVLRILADGQPNRAIRAQQRFSDLYDPSWRRNLDL